MTSHFVNWVLPLRYRLYTSPPRGVLNSTRAALTPAPYFRHRGNRRILIIPFNHPPLLSNYHSDNRSTFPPRMTKIRSIDILLRSCLRRSSIFTYIANFSPTRRRRETSFAIISSKVSSLLHTQLARKREVRRCAPAKSAQRPVIIQTSVNSANFGITRFKSNRRNSTECRFSASGADNTCRPGANQRKMSRQEASSQLPDLLYPRISSDSFRHSPSSPSPVASDFSRVSSRRWFRNSKPVASKRNTPVPKGESWKNSNSEERKRRWRGRERGDFFLRIFS